MDYSIKVFDPDSNSTTTINSYDSSPEVFVPELESDGWVVVSWIEVDDV